MKLVPKLIGLHTIENLKVPPLKRSRGHWVHSLVREAVAPSIRVPVPEKWLFIAFADYKNFASL